MANKSIPLVNADHVIATPAVEIPLAALLTLAPVTDNAVNKTGIVLTNHRESIRVMRDGVPIAYTVSVYVQREAVTDEEKSDVATIAAERKANADKRMADEDAKREREIKRAAELTRAAVIDTISEQQRRQDEARRILGLA